MLGEGPASRSYDYNSKHRAFHFFTTRTFETKPEEGVFVFSRRCTEYRLPIKNGKETDFDRNSGIKLAEVFSW